MDDLRGTVAHGMRSRSRNTRRLVKASCSVLNKDRELLVIAVLLLVGAAASLALGCGVIYASIVTSQSEADKAGLVLFSMAIIFATFLLITVLSMFFQGALVAGAYERMMGGDPTLRSSMKAALKHINSLTAWVFTMFFAGFLGNFVGSLPWLLATYLVVPIIVIESKGPIASLKRSASLIRNTWGENLIGNVGFGFLTFLLCLPSIGIAGVGLWLALTVYTGSTSDRVIIIAFATAFGWFIMVMLFVLVLHTIFQTALYFYAVTDASSATDVSFIGFKKALLAESIVSTTKTSIAETYQPQDDGRYKLPNRYKLPFEDTDNPEYDPPIRE